MPRGLLQKFLETVKMESDIEAKIVYILGAGRSGTTLMDIILGNSDNIFSAGELNRFAERSGKPHDPRDENVSRYWEEIHLKLQNYFPLIIGLSRRMEYHNSFINRLFINKKKLVQYKEFNLQLFDEIRSISGDKKIIVDSSKYPFRALSLYQIFGNDLKVIYLKKEPISVIRSFANGDVEQPSKSFFKANLYLLTVNLLCRIVFTKIKSPKMVVTYDQLVNDTLNTITLINNNLNLDLSSLAYKISKNQSLEVGYLFDGNRLRKEKRITIQNSKLIKDKNFKERFWNKIHQFFWYN